MFLNKISALLYYLEALKCIKEASIFVNFYRKHGQVKNEQTKNLGCPAFFFNFGNSCYFTSLCLMSGLSGQGVILFQMIQALYL